MSRRLGKRHPGPTQCALEVQEENPEEGENGQENDLADNMNEFSPEHAPGALSNGFPLGNGRGSGSRRPEDDQEHSLAARCAGLDDHKAAMKRLPGYAREVLHQHKHLKEEGGELDEQEWLSHDHQPVALPGSLPADFGGGPRTWAAQANHSGL